MTTEKGRAMVLGALADARLPEDYSQHDRARDFAMVLMRDPQALRVLAAMLDLCGWMEALSEPGARATPDLGMALDYREGRRSVATDLMALLVTAFVEPPKVSNDDGNDLTRR